MVAVFLSATMSSSANTRLDALRDSFREAAIASASPSEEVTSNFLRYSEYGRANDVLLLQLYTSIALPDAEVKRLLGLWETDHFTDIDYADQTRGRWQPTLHLTRLQSLTKLYANPASSWYHNSQLKSMIHGGMNWWFANMPKCPNWWHNDIGVPKKMTTIMLMVFDELTEEEIEGGVKVLERSKFGRTGQNKSWLAGNQLMKGMLLDDEELVIKARDIIAEEICITDSEEGIRDDWSFHQHGPQMQFGNYGLAYLEGLSFWIRALEGTDYQFTQEQCGIVTSLLDKGISWCMWKGVMDPSYCGRQCFPDGGSGKAYSMAVAADHLSAAAFKKGDSLSGERFHQIALSNLQPEIYPAGQTGAVYFDRSDCGVYRTADWYASVRMSSERTIGYEFTNRENTLAHFSASGAVLVMVSGREYENIFACWDWRKVPGVTSYDDGKPIRSSDKREDKQNNSLNVGGKIKGDRMEAHMQLDRDSLFAFKEVIFTPRFIRETGSEIYTLNPEVSSVTTSIDQNLKQGWVRRGHLRVSGRRCEWVWHNGIGYVSLDGSHIHVSKVLQTGDWGAIDPALEGRSDSKKVFKAWIEHPEAICANGGRGHYDFVVVPSCSVREMKKIIRQEFGSRQESMEQLSQRVFDRAAVQLSAMDARLAEDKTPRTYFEAQDSILDADLRWWCSGFLPGSLWYVYEATGDESIKELACKQTEKLSGICSLKTDHDIGFQVNCSYGNAYRLTGDTAYLPVIEAAAAKLAARMDPSVGCIKSWNYKEGCHYPVIIDNMMNLELLMRASELFGCDSLRQVALLHANTTMANHFREDYSTYHLVDYLPGSGEVDHKQTVQGYAHETAWSRGQAWGLYGYTMMYELSGEKAYLKQAEHIAEFLLSVLPEDGMPYWDFNAPGTPDAVPDDADGYPENYAWKPGEPVLRDASAGAIMASAFVQLGKLTKDKALARSCRKIAEIQIRTLASEEYLADAGTNGGFLLKHSVGNLHGNSEVDVPLTYADYYFLEALIRF